ncbi:PREDICTED: keratin, type I cytoskeletal 18-A-like [Nanorana parkeri]|uniref:keratin, type I cytoskeletal 18-A-like n=1 Tax=Nanorana parkeri TaxID=125878 RepID=UPI00085500D2|nr:PREDICTED: keratin, type I cytoskeletal 18-A-like [Nanorana parkeri]
MASLVSPRGGPSRLRFSSSSLSYDGKPWAVSSAPALNSALSNGNNDKEVMQNLNNRLASYLEKVASLEKSNRKLEIQIREKMAANDYVKKDYNDQYNLILSLRKQIGDSIFGNTRLLLAIDNTKLAVDDFQDKLNTESALRQSVERDMVALRRAKETNEANNESMRADLDSLQNELLTLKADHEKELAAVKNTLARTKVEVELDAAQGPDLQSLLSEIRAQYEDIIRKNKEDADTLFQAQYETMTSQIAKEDEDVRRAQDELRERRTVLQGLQLELETAGNQINALRRDLDDTELRYKKELERLQGSIGAVEQDMSEVLRAVQNTKLEYEALWRIKETLEAEIAEYRRLLDGESPEKTPEPKQHDIRTKKIVKIVTQTLVDGKIVGESSEVEEFENAEKAN